MLVRYSARASQVPLSGPVPLLRCIVVLRPLERDRRVVAVDDVALGIDEGDVVAERAGGALEAPGASDEVALDVQDGWVRRGSERGGLCPQLVPVGGPHDEKALFVKRGRERPQVARVSGDEVAGQVPLGRELDRNADRVAGGRKERTGFERFEMHGPTPS